MRRLKTILLVLGLVFLAYAINTVGGSAAIALSLLQMRWWLLLALISTFVAQLMRTVAWGRVLDSYGGRISLATLWRGRLLCGAMDFFCFCRPLLCDPTQRLLGLSANCVYKTGGTAAMLP